MFPSGYHSNCRSDLAPFLPAQRGLSVLELGCAEGLTGAWLKRSGYASRVVGIEGFAAAARAARHCLDDVYLGDLNDFEMPGDERFDLILAADIIEHLVEPKLVLQRFLPRLSPAGWLVTSTPNVRYWRVIADLVFRGRWDYGSNVVLDPTHLRFFTKHSICRLHEEVGLHVEELGHIELSGRRARLDIMSGGHLRDFLCGQHVVRSRRGSGGAP
mgnify:CR=1 FL=1